MEKAMAPHSSTLAWKIPWTEEPGSLQSMGLLRVGHDWATSLSFFTFIGEGNGNPLQCSCLENPRDGGAWWAVISGVAQSRTWLKWLSSSRQSSPWSGCLWRPSPTTHDLCSTHKSPIHTVTGFDQVQLVPLTTRSQCHRPEPKAITCMRSLLINQSQPMLPKSKLQAIVPFPRSSQAQLPAPESRTLAHDLPIYTFQRTHIFSYPWLCSCYSHFWTHSVLTYFITNFSSSREA